MEISTRDLSKVEFVNKKHHSSSLSVFYQRFVVSRRIHVWIIYLHMFNCHGKEISYMDRVAIDMWFLFQSILTFSNRHSGDEFCEVLGLIVRPFSNMSMRRMEFCIVSYRKTIDLRQM